MSESYTGGCQCGAVNYHVEGPLPPAYCCHCGECKKQSASAFSMSVTIDFSRLDVVGQTAMFEVTGYSGVIKQCHFCPQCGTRLWHRSAAAPDYATLKVGTIENGQDIAPRSHIWVSKKQSGILLDPDVPAYETQPEDMKAWRESL
jgi:hypothetical protein